MKAFAALYDAIDRTTSTNAKVAAMARYFETALSAGQTPCATGDPRADAAWTVFFLTGRRLKRLIPAASIREWTLAATGLDGWLLEECYAVVGDGAETAALILEQISTEDQMSVRATDEVPLTEWVEARILPLKSADPATQQARVTEWWRTLDRQQRFVLVHQRHRVGGGEQHGALLCRRAAQERDRHPDHLELAVQWLCRAPCYLRERPTRSRG